MNGLWPFWALVVAPLLASPAEATQGRGFAIELYLGSHIVAPSSWLNLSVFSMSAWIKPYATDLMWGQAIGNMRRDMKTGAGLVASEDSLIFFAGSSFSLCSKNLSVPVLPYVWHHAVGTFDVEENGGSAKLYVDGTLVGSAVGMGATNYPAGELYVGALFDTSHRVRFAGQLDEVAVWSRVLTQNEVTRIHQGPPLYGNEAGLELLYSGDIDNATHAIDTSGKGRHGRKVEGTDCAPEKPLYSSCFVSYRADCLSEINRTDGREAWCTPFQNASVCGDKAVTGDEQCDSGSDCENASCACSANMSQHDLKCSNQSTCSVGDTETACLGVLMSCNSCECIVVDGINCISNFSCTVYDFPYEVLEEYAKACSDHCSSNVSCFNKQLASQTCMFSSNKAECEAYGCSWCGKICQQSSTDCRPMCGNAILDYGEACDNGRTDGQQGCWENCLGIYNGWICNQTGCYEETVNGDGQTVSHGTIAGIAVAGAGCITITISLLTYFTLLRKTKRSSKMSLGGRSLKRKNSVKLIELFRPFDPKGTADVSQSRTVPLGDLPFTVSPNCIDFQNGCALCPVNETVTREFSLTNSSKQIFWRLSPDLSEKYLIEFSPSSGMIAEGKDQLISVKIKVLCTTTIEAKVAILFSEKPLEETEKADILYTVVPMHIQTARSCLIDPDHITVFTPAVGEGATGTVYKGVYSGQQVAVKVLKFQELGERQQDFEREVAMLEGLRTAFAVLFFGSVKIPGQMCLVTEFLPLGDLWNAVKTRNLSFDYRVRAAYDCCRGMAYLHGCHILHRDLKPDNLLVVSFAVDAPVVCKLTDFGTTREVGDLSGQNFTKGIGTPIYMAPEALQGSPYDFSADVFSFAVLLYAIYIEGDPYPASKFKNSWDVCDFIVAGKRLEFPQHCPEWYRKLIEVSWNQEPKKRPQFQEIIHIFRPNLPFDENAPASTSDLNSVQQLSSPSLNKSELSSTLGSLRDTNNLQTL